MLSSGLPKDGQGSRNPTVEDMGLPKISSTFFGDPTMKDYSTLGSLLGSPYSGKPPDL